jgi:ubiquitin-conjugating enzyme E2 M
VQIPNDYPHEVPKVHCDTKIYHPNIDLEGKICLNILREDWKPVLNLQTLIYGLVFLLLEPNDDDPLNKDAAEIMQTDQARFERNVKKAMRGENVEGFQFERCLVK